MQLMVDINDALESSGRAEAAIKMLRAAADILENSDIVKHSRADAPAAPKDSAPPVKENVVQLFKSPTATAPAAPAPLTEAPPPPPPLIDIPPPPLPPASLLPSVLNSPGNIPVASAPVEFDSSGVPFDDRIHQKKRGQKTDGSWKLQKGIDPAVVQAVISELSAAGKMAPAGTVQPRATTAASSAASQSPAAGVFGKSPLPAGATPADNPAPPPPPSSDAMPTVTFRALVAKCAAATKDGKMTPQEVQGLCQQHGAPTLMALNSMAHLIPDVNASLDATLLMKG